MPREAPTMRTALEEGLGAAMALTLAVVVEVVGLALLRRRRAVVEAEAVVVWCC